MSAQISRPRRPSAPKKARIASPVQSITLPAYEPPQPGRAVTDEFGLSVEKYKGVPRISRQYLALAYRHLGLDPSVSAVENMSAVAGTLPEMVFYGALLARGFSDTARTARSFAFQSFELGGRRVPGGAVVDFVVFINNRAIGVRVDSVYHNAANPFGLGGAEIQASILQKERLEARANLSIEDVNLAALGYPLENGPDQLVDYDIDRVLAA